METGDSVSVYSDRIVASEDGITLTVSTVDPLVLTDAHLSGQIKNVHIDIGPLVEEVASGDRISAQWSADSRIFPVQGAGFSSQVYSEIPSALADSLLNTARENGYSVLALGYAMIITGNEYGNSFISSSTVSMGIPTEWVMKNGGRNAVWIIFTDSSGRSWILNTKQAGYDKFGNMLFVADVPQGFGTFSLVALTHSSASASSGHSSSAAAHVKATPVTTTPAEVSLAALPEAEETPTQDEASQFATHTLLTSGAGLVGSVMIRRRSNLVFSDMIPYLLKITGVFSLFIVYWFVTTIIL
jgi:hypothetical protein